MNLTRSVGWVDNGGVTEVSSGVAEVAVGEISCVAVVGLLRWCCCVNRFGRFLVFSFLVEVTFDHGD